MNYDLPRLHRKNDSAEYQRVHKWVYITLGKADHCENDTSHISTRYHWANISHQYLMETADWKQLCPTCHRKLDGISTQFRLIKSLQSTGNTNAAKPVVCPDLNVSFLSTRDAAKSTGILATAINNCLHGRTKTAGKLRWQVGRV